MNHEDILKMIEAVDPKDKTRLDEINSHVWCLLNGHEYTEALRDHTLYKASHRGAIEKYCTSRDALKQIRPEGSYKIMNYSNMPHIKNGTVYDYPGVWEGRWFSKKEYEGGYKEIASPHLSTEELAELHAIIQAIAYEKSMIEADGGDE